MKSKTEKMVKYWKRNKLETRVFGALEALMGAGIVGAAYAVHKEVGASAIPLYIIGGLAVVDGVGDAVYGNVFALLEKLCGSVYNFEKRKESKTKLNKFINQVWKS